METKTIDVTQLTQQQIEDLKQQIILAEKKKKEAVKVNRASYKKLASDTVKELFKPLLGLSKHNQNVKKLVFDSFQAVLDMKSEIYGIKEGQQSHTFTDEEGTISIKMGFRVTDAYDDTFSIGMMKVNNYMVRLAGTEGGERIQRIISALMKTDAKGNPKPSRVLELRQYANEEQDEELNDGVHIIEESYKPVKSCQFVEVKYKDADNNWQPLPLSISAFDLKPEPVAETEKEPENE